MQNPSNENADVEVKKDYSAVTMPVVPVDAIASILNSDVHHFATDCTLASFAMSTDSTPSRRIGDEATGTISVSKYELERRLDELLRLAARSGYELSIVKTLKAGVKPAENLHEHQKMKTSDYDFKGVASQAQY